MFSENISNFVDGKAVDEKDIATIVGSVDDTVIYTDDQENLFFLSSADPSAFETGTVALKADLTPLEDADKQLKKKILEAMKEGRS